MLNWHWALVSFAIFSTGIFALALWRFVSLNRVSDVLLKKTDCPESLENRESSNDLWKPIQANQALLIELKARLVIVEDEMRIQNDIEVGLKRQIELSQGEDYDEATFKSSLTVLKSERLALLKEVKRLASLNAEWRDHVTSLKQLTADYQAITRQWESLVYHGADTKQTPDHEPILLARLERILQDIKQEINELIFKLRDIT